MKPYLSIMKYLHLLAALALAMPSARADGLPSLGDASQSAFSPQQQRQLGNEIMREIRNSRHYDDDPELTDYINHLGYRLVAHSPENTAHYHFFIVNDNTINAFALPGGYIGVHTGLILATQSESELASVLAHELGHEVQHHMSRMAAHQKRLMIPALAALAVAILASRTNTQVSDAALAAAQAGTAQSTLNFSRHDEEEADRVGLQILIKSGFDPRAMPAFFRRLLKKTRLYENDAPVYLRTHPLTTQRIADLANRVADLPYRQVPDSLMFQLMRAKLRAAQGTPQTAVQTFENNLREQKYANEAAERYGLIQALIRARAFPEADRQLALLLKQGPASPAIDTLAAKLKTAEGKGKDAIIEYRAALRDFPGYRALYYGYIEALLQNRNSATALKTIDGKLASHPDDYRLYAFQAHAYAQQGNNLLRHQAMAEAYAHLNNLSAAIEQLQLALKSGGGTFYQLAAIEARMKALRAQSAANPKP